MEREKFVVIGGVAAGMSAASRAKRIDVFATALQSGMTVEEISRLDLSYSPPFAPFWERSRVEEASGNTERNR